MNMLACFLRLTISNGTLGGRIRVHVNVILIMQMEHEQVFFSSKVVTCSSKILRNFQALLESTRYEFGSNACEKTVDGVREVFKIYRKNEIKRQPSIPIYSLVSCMSNQVTKDNHFVN